MVPPPTFNGNGEERERVRERGLRKLSRSVYINTEFESFANVRLLAAYCTYYFVYFSEVSRHVVPLALLGLTLCAIFSPSV